MKIRYAPLALACALMVAASAQAAAVTYYFGGKLDTVPGGPSFAIGDTFTGSFTFESTSINLNSFGLSYIGDYVDNSSAIEATVNGYAFSSANASAGSLNYVGISVYDNAPARGDLFQATSGIYGIPDPVTGPSIDGLFPGVLTLSLGDYSGAVFNSIALPSSLSLSSFNEARFSIQFFDFTGNSGLPGVGVGSLTYLSTATPPVPEASTSAMLAFGLSALALVRRRKGL